MADDAGGASDSLELFTDPVCNIFAMVCFIVILLVVLSSVRKEALQSVEQESVQVDARTATVQELRRQLAEAERPEVQARLGEIASLREALERKRAVQREAERREDLVIAQLGDPTRGTEALAELVPELEGEIRQIESAIQDAQARSEVSLALPRERKVIDGNSVSMVLDGGVAYMVTQLPKAFDFGSFCEWLNALDPECIDIAQSSIECAEAQGRGSQRVVIRKASGVSLRQPSWQSSPMWRRWLGALTGKPRVIVFLCVNPDSHAEFLVLRRALQEAGIFYNVVPMRAPYELEWARGVPSAQ